MANYNKVGKSYDYDGMERTVLRFSAKFIADNGRSPKLKEIVDGLNINCCINTINSTLTRLENKGFIHKYGTRPYRFFEITNAGLDSVGMQDLFGMSMEFHENKEEVNTMEDVKEISPVIEDAVIPVKEEAIVPAIVEPEEISYKNFMKFRKAYCSNEAQAMLELLIENDLIDAKAFNKFVKEM